MDDADLIITQLRAELYQLRQRNADLQSAAVEHQRVVDALELSEARYRTLVEHFPNGAVFLFDHNLRYILAGGTGLQASGLSREMVEGKTIWQLLPPDIATRDEPVLRAALHGAATRIEVPFDEQVFVVHTLPVSDARNVIVGGMVMTQEITDQKRVEEALRKSEVEYRAIFELAGAGTVEVDVQTACFRRVNRRFCEFTGYTAEELLTMTFLDVTHPQDRPQDYVAVQQMASGKLDEFSREKRYVRKDGIVVWGELTATVLRTPDDQTQYTIAIVHDITARKRLEDAAARLLAGEQSARVEAEEALRIRDAFLSLAAHELKTPLTTMLGHAEMLQRRMTRDYSLTDRDERALSALVRQTRRLNELTSALLDVSRLETGQLTIESALLDVRALVAHVVAQVQPALDVHTLTWDVPDEPLMVAGDELRLEQMLENLLGNAIKYSRDGGVITVHAEQRGSEACIAVSDHGIGIPEAELAQLFGRFYRATNAQANAIGGNGIGLYVVNEIVGLHGGHVEVESTEGHGSTFTICLPVRGSISDEGVVAEP